MARAHRKKSLRTIVEPLSTLVHPAAAAPTGEAHEERRTPHDEQGRTCLAAIFSHALSMTTEGDRLSGRLLNARNVTEERALASEIQQRLSTVSFRAALSEESVSSGTNGWSTLLKVRMRGRVAPPRVPCYDGPPLSSLLAHRCPRVLVLSLRSSGLRLSQSSSRASARRARRTSWAH